MMGHSHALSGALVWLAGVPALTMTGMPVGPAELVAGALVCAGAAMLPDLDHPSATIAQTFGPVTWALSKAVNWVSGGHRNATHSILFAALMGFGAHLLASYSKVASDVVVFLMIGLAFRAIGIGIPKKRLASAAINVVLAAGALGAFMLIGVRYDWLGVAIGVGCLAHVVGDCLTERGCPVLWPIKGRWLLPYKIGIKTGQKFEMKILAPILSIAVVGLLVWRLYPSFTAV
ncbi:metal-dependent hydrolase [Rhizohabitans arisaemae]|uniref:metal-dependent hydrolase n=1 Tax=Rhizohabitans arisaemae TaxID=2720610 RepID=UPI0024B0ECEB|nr:metal-dependent hydrolase [Rhizohabitans arisaemae]